MAGRTLLDIFTGGRVKHTGVGKYRGSPGAAPTVPAVFSKLYESMTEYQERGMSEEVFPAGKNIFGQPTEPITQGNLYEIAMGAAGVGAVVKTASTARRLFSGWAENLRKYRGESKATDAIINRASRLVNENDIKGTQNSLVKLNNKLGLGNKVVVPEIKGAAGAGTKQAAQAKGATKKAKEASMTRSRKEVERKAKRALEEEQKTGYEPYHRGTQKLDR